MSSSGSWKDVISSYLKYYDDYFMHLDNDLHFLLFVEGHTDRERLYSLFHKENIKKESKADYQFNISKKDILYDFSNGFKNVDSYGRFLDDTPESVSDPMLQNEFQKMKNSVLNKIKGITKITVRLSDGSTKIILHDDNGRKWTEDNASDIVSSTVLYGKLFKNFEFVIECMNKKNSDASNLPHIYCLGIIDRDAENHESLPNLAITECHDYEATLIMPIFKKYINKKIDIFFQNCLNKIIKGRFSPSKDILMHLDIHNVLNSSISSRPFYSVLGFNSENDLYIDICSKFPFMNGKSIFDKSEKNESDKVLNYLNNIFRNTIIEQIINVLLFTTKQGIVEHASFVYQAKYGNDYDIIFSSKLQFQVNKRIQRDASGQYVINGDGKISKICNYNCIGDSTFDFSRNFEIGPDPFLDDIIHYCSDYVRFKSILVNQVKNNSELIFKDFSKSSSYSPSGVISESDFNILFKKMTSKWLANNNTKIDNSIINIFRLSNGHYILQGLIKIFSNFHNFDENTLFEDIINFLSSDDLVFVYDWSPLKDFKIAYNRYLIEKSYSVSRAR